MLFPLATILHWVQNEIGTIGYPMLFGLLLACGMGLPLPEDIPLMFAGYFVADGKMNLVIACISAWCGIMAGDCVLYTLGYKFGLKITRVPIIGTHINKERIDWAHMKFEKYGAWVIGVGRLFAGIRAAVVITAGTIRFRFVHFLIADGLAAILSGGLFIAVGYWGRLHLGSPEQLEARINHYKFRVTLVLIGLVLIYAGWQWWKAKRRRDRQREAIKRARLTEAASRHQP